MGPFSQLSALAQMRAAEFFRHPRPREEISVTDAIARDRLLQSTSNMILNSNWPEDRIAT